MSKEYIEALERLYKCNDDDYTLGYQQHDYKLLQEALQRLEQIDNANPSEALESLHKVSSKVELADYDDYWEVRNAYARVEQYLLKSQEQEKENDKYKEQLGCPLEVVFKALTNGVYYEDVTNWMRYMAVDLHLNLEGDYVLYFTDEEYLLTKNYKKTWWLRKDKSE